MLILPDVIYDPLQLKCIEIWEARPNFITSECVTGDILLLENYENEDLEKGVNAHYFPSFEEIEKFLSENCVNGDLLITMGAGNVVEIGEDLLKK